MSALNWINLALRALMEFGVVGAFAFWGYQTGEQFWIKILLGIAAPLIGFGIWGAVDFHQAGRFSEPLRLVEELLPGNPPSVGRSPYSPLGTTSWFTSLGNVCSKNNRNTLILKLHKRIINQCQKLASHPVYA